MDVLVETFPKVSIVVSVAVKVPAVAYWCRIWKGGRVVLTGLPSPKSSSELIAIPSVLRVRTLPTLPPRFCRRTSDRNASTVIICVAVDEPPRLDTINVAVKVPAFG